MTARWLLIHKLLAHAASAERIGQPAEAAAYRAKAAELRPRRRRYRRRSRRGRQLADQLNLFAVLPIESYLTNGLNLAPDLRAALEDALRAIQQAQLVLTRWDRA